MDTKLLSTESFFNRYMHYVYMGASDYQSTLKPDKQKISFFRGANYLKIFYNYFFGEIFNKIDQKYNQ